MIDMESVFSAVRTEFLYNTDALRLQKVYWELEENKQTKKKPGRTASSQEACRS